MRNLPIALVNINNEERFIIDTFKNNIITHGHPRAIIGSILIGGAQIYFLKKEKINFGDFQNYIRNLLQSSIGTAKKDKQINGWLRSQNNNSLFEKNYENTIKEVLYFVDAMRKYFSRGDEEYYRITKAFDRNFKGSGVSTAACAIYLTFKHTESPENALFKAVNMVGSDTDTIVSFVGSLIGASNIDILDSKKIRNLIHLLQDRRYFKNMGEFLWEINFGDLDFIDERNIEKTEAFLKIMAWEIGLHEMFWDALERGDRIVHPTLGKGTIQDKVVKDVKREDYVVKIIRIEFDVGQTAYFHSRVCKDGSVSGKCRERA